MINNDRARDDKSDEPDQSSSGVPRNNPSSGGKRRSDTRKPGDEPHIGKALRSVYDQTVNEAIPNEMLDLLGRLD